LTQGNAWQPEYIKRVEGVLSTSTGAARVVTDAGRAYVKAMGNPEGPHVLASEWVGTKLASLFGLATFDISLLNFDGTVVIAYRNGRVAATGPAICLRAESGIAWGGANEELDALENPDDVTRLVVFDTWIRNRDRHFPSPTERKPNLDNVFLSSERVANRYTLMAMDHTHCFTNHNELNARQLRRGDLIRDPGIYGLFPAFARRLNRSMLGACTAELSRMDVAAIRAIVRSIPHEWEVDAEARDALVGFIIERAQYLGGSLAGTLEARHDIEMQG
jgi:hypothetical protein